ncbi:MAG: hypothetical protein WBL27_12170 [Salinimicrobium sp.]
MKALLILASEEAAKSTSYKIGYAIGHFVGGHFFEMAFVAVLFAALVIYLVVRNSKKEKDWK